MLKGVIAIAEQVADVYIRHTGQDFIGLLAHGSAVKGGFLHGLSDIDFQVFFYESIFHKPWLLPVKLSIKIHQDLAKIDTSPFRYIQCKALSTSLPKGMLGPIPGTYQLIAGRLPIKEATNEQLKQSAHESLGQINTLPEYLSLLLDHGKDRLTQLVRLLCTKVTLYMYQVLAIEKENAIQIWNMPKNKVITLLPKGGKQYAVRFYEHAKCFYPDELSVNDALEMVRNAISFFESVKKWYTDRIDIKNIP